MSGQPMATVWRRLAAELAAAGLDSPQAEARLLVAHVMDLPLNRLAALEQLPDQAVAALDRLVARRRAGEPLQHLTGQAWFRTVQLAVGPGVFLPRPETEVMVGWALDRLRAQLADGAAPIVVELCAGSGAISAALAAEAPGCRQWAVERAASALVYLRRNLAASEVVVVAGDMADALPELDHQVDLVLANPPYVPTGRRPDLPATVRDFDPPEALYAGPDGLDASRVVAQTAGRLLRAGGQVASEHDDDQGRSVPALFVAAGFGAVADQVDLTGRSRFVTATWDGRPDTMGAGAGR